MNRSSVIEAVHAFYPLFTLPPNLPFCLVLPDCRTYENCISKLLWWLQVFNGVHVYVHNAKGIKLAAKDQRWGRGLVVCFVQSSLIQEKKLPETPK